MFKISAWKNVFRFTSLILLVAYFFVAPILILPKMKEYQKNLFITQKLVAGEVLELWNVESFEGGSASRGRYLEKMAIKFESENKGNFIVVKTMNLEQAILNLEQGNLPNIVSFGIGFGEYILPKLTNLKSDYGVKNKFVDAGKYGLNLKAIPFCYSGYFNIKNGEVNNKQTGYAGKDLINPLKAIKKVDNFYGKSDNLSGYDAYAEFVDDKFEFLIGTARDLHRCKNRENNGRMSNNVYDALTDYTDLVQYLAVVNCANEQEFLAEKYVEFVLKKENQMQLSNIGLFSPVIDIYNQSSNYYEFEKKFNEINQILNVFYDKEHIEKFKKESKESLRS